MKNELLRSLFEKQLIQNNIFKKIKNYYGIFLKTAY